MSEPAALQRIARAVRRDLPTGNAHQWARLVMNHEVDARLSILDRSRLDALEVSGTDHHHRGWRSYTSIHWPQHDICDPELDLGQQFDVVLAEQVLEHVENPWAAVLNMQKMCRPDGLVAITTPFLIRRHEVPKDYWRFTEDGLRILLDHAGLDVESTSSWGNRRCVVGNFKRWTRHRWWRPLTNEPDFPVVVWAFARKPAAAT